MEYFGNKDILKHQKTGFLSSRKCPAEVVLRSYEWAKLQRKEGNCIICGNHSQIEKDVFEILLKGEQPLILVLPRGLRERWDRNWIESIENGRLLIVAPFPKEIIKVSRASASLKNQTIIDLSDNVTIGFKTPKGQLDKLLRNMEIDYV